MSKSAKPVSEIDRLIELASDEKPRSSSAGRESDSSPLHALSLEDQKDPRPSMWRVLIQLRVLLPYLAKLMPLVERGLLGTNLTGQSAPTLDTSSLDRGIAGVGEAQRDLHTVVKAQTAEIHILRGEVAALTLLIDKNLLLQEDTAANVVFLRKLATISACVAFVLLTLLIGLVLTRVG